MRRALRLSFLATLIAASFAAASAMGACGGSDTYAGAPGDASSDATASGDAGGGDAGAISVGASDVSVYVGQPATLDTKMTAPSGATFAWSLKSSPNGSALKPSMQLGGSGAASSFTPDVAGTYDVHVTATASGGGSAASADVMVTAFAAPIFYIQARPYETPPYLQIEAVGSDGQGAHAITCAMVPPADAGPDSSRADFINQSIFLGIDALDVHEGAPGAASLVAFTSFRTASTGGTTEVGLSVGAADSTGRGARSRGRATIRQTPTAAPRPRSSLSSRPARRTWGR